MATQVQDQDSAWPGRSGVRVRAVQDSSTTRADFEQDRVMQLQDQDRARCGTRTRQAGRLGLTVLHPGPAAAGFRWWARYGAATAQSRPALIDRVRLVHTELCMF